MHDLDLIRAAAEDVASARVLLQERASVLDAIVQTALDHGVPLTQVMEASEASLNGHEPAIQNGQPQLVA